MNTPPLLPYVLGLVISQMTKVECNRPSGPEIYPYDFSKPEAENISNPKIRSVFVAGRTAMALVSAATIGLLMFLFPKHPLLSLCAALLLWANPLFQRNGVRMLTEPIQLFLEAIFFFVLVRSRPFNPVRYKKPWADLFVMVLLGVAAGLGVLAKPNSAMVLFNYSLLLLLTFVIARVAKAVVSPNVLLKAVAVLLFSSIVIVALWPRLWSNPIRESRVLTHQRLVMLRDQQEGPVFHFWDKDFYRSQPAASGDFQGALKTLPDRVVMFFYRTTINYGTLRSFLLFPIDLVLLLLGVVFLTRSCWRNGFGTEGLILGWFAVTTLFYGITLPLDWDRLYYLALLPVTLVEGYALAQFLNLCSAKTGKAIQSLKEHHKSFFG